jgi:hypothetical protein
MKAEPKPAPEIDPSHQRKRNVLRVVGPMLLGIGLILLIVGTVDFFRAFGGHGEPKLFWFNFIALPLMWLGFVLSSAGFAGSVQRYMAGETAPVAKDTVNYLADGTKEGIKTIAKAMGEGLASAGGRATEVLVCCHKCNTTNEADAKYCKSCGAVLAKTVRCPVCNELNDPDAHFCDACGKPITT